LSHEYALRAESRPVGYALIWSRGDADVLALPAGATVELADAEAPMVTGERFAVAYANVESIGEHIVGTADIEAARGRLGLTDTWSRVGEDTWRIDRRLEVRSVRAATGVRLLLELAPLLPKRAYGDFHYFAPPALTDLNDLNEDGIEEYLETRSLHFREDRLNLLSVLAFSDSAGLGICLSRADRPEFDTIPERKPGQLAFLQTTDIGSLGIEPAEAGSVRLVAAYPFAERTRSNALLVRERAPFAAFAPATPGGALEASWLVRFVSAEDMHAALWAVWTRRFAELDPRPVVLPSSLEAIASARVEASLDYFIEETEAPFAAGFVTNCHPQDGKQISNVIQFGFTGQNNLNAYNLLRNGDVVGDAERRRKALRVLDFFTAIAGQNPHGLIPGYYNADTKKFGSWWTGLILPLAYAEPGADLEALMGPLYGHLREVIDALAGRDGIYLRCVVEEYEALLAAYRYEKERGDEHSDWLKRALLFGEFLVSVQNDDGSWFRAYTPEGRAITAPVTWFGQTGVQQKSSTSTPVPLLVELSRLTGETGYLAAAKRASAFAREHFVERMRHNGGIHDSIYAKPQLVDGESIMFAMRALLELYKATGETQYLAGAERAARMVVTWICLWDIPLPPESTLGRYGFRSTGWMACDAPGAGYIHPMGVLAVPDLVEIGLRARSRHLLQAAALLQAGCNETVETSAKSWGYARSGLQEEGLLISWWFADDPMFGSTAFGGRGKGEGNKTCLPWISAVGAFACHEMTARYGTTDIDEIGRRERPQPGSRQAGAT
jgi:hypothetical protein